MSKNVVDAVIAFTKSNDLEDIFCFIPSYRQIDTPRGYVNDWSILSFLNYVRNRSSIVILRDHAGSHQGSSQASWWESLQADIDSGIDAIHVDPWKEASACDVALAAVMTAAVIQFCDTKRKDLFYEIGTEQAIRPYSPRELDSFLQQVKMILSARQWSRVAWVVVQSGSHVFDLDNTGNAVFHENLCADLVTVCKSFGKRAKEHNADFLTALSMSARQDVGVDAFNIAPELGSIESRVFMEQLLQHDMNAEYSELVRVCFQSDRWKRWATNHGNMLADRLAIASCHYHFMQPWFVKMATALRRKTDIDQIIRDAITERLEGLACLIRER